jgi:inner membrane protein
VASAFAHAAAGAALWPLFRTARTPRLTWALGAALAVLPDADVLGFRFGVPYGAPLGHRGLTHALLVAALVGGAAGWALARRADQRDAARLAAYLALAMATHGLLDAMTTGGLGVALLAPFDMRRYFFQWRPIAVSPLGVRPFFTQRGLAVLANEALWVGFPALAVASLGTRLRPPAKHDARAV